MAGKFKAWVLFPTCLKDQLRAAWEFGSSTAPGVWQVLSELLPLKPLGMPHKGARCVCEVSRPV